jgi:hypothetical protein
MVYSAALSNNGFGMYDNTAEVMDTQSLSKLGLDRDGDASSNFDESFDEKPQRLRRNATLIAPPEDAVNKKGLESLR